MVIQGKLSVSKQCELLSINRSSLYYKQTLPSSYELELMRLIDQIYLKYPFYGSRQMCCHLRQLGHFVNRKRVQRLMRLMAICAIYPKLNTSKNAPGHKIYPYLLRGLNIDRIHQVWSADITYIPIQRGFMYLVAIMDWYSRRILTWRLSNTLDTAFCVDALQEALTLYDSPDIFNTDQGAQFTSQIFTTCLSHAGIKISMDGKGCWVDNVMIEPFWKSLKYECVYLSDLASAGEAKQVIESWIYFYNNERPHSTFGGQTLLQVYNQGLTDISMKQAA